MMISALEKLLRRTTPVYINSFNQPTYLRDTVVWCVEHGFHDITVVDNQSTSPELLSYFASNTFQDNAKLWVLDANVGPRKAIMRIIRRFGDEDPFVFTDPDLKLPSPPDPQFLRTLYGLAERHNVLKVGLALDISEPDLFRGLEVEDRENQRFRAEDFEKRYWMPEQEREANVFAAPVDTTFFLYVPQNGEAPDRLRNYGRRQPRVPALRVAGDGFLAQHRPWYKDDGMSDKEREFYVQSCNKFASWVAAQKQDRQTG